MRILIASGIFEPEPGGPATYAPKIAGALAAKGWDVTVITYSSQAHYDFDSSYNFKLVRIVRWGKILNRIRFFFALMRLARKADVIYTLDWFAAGVPVAVAAGILEKPYIVRVGGDYVWEQRYLESGAEPVSLLDFYERGIYRQSRYRPFFYVIRYVIAHAKRVVFNSDTQREMYEKYYKLDAARTATIFNPVPRVELAGIVRGEVEKEFVFWGRFIVMKNVATLVRAFARAKLPSGYSLTLIGDGPQKRNIVKLIRELGLEKRIYILSSMRSKDALERIKNARAFILPSWTDISPNQVYEALAIGVPALVTQENYLKVRDQLPVTIDPHSVEDVAQKLEMLADDEQYADFAERFAAISIKRGWADVVHEFVDVLGTVVHDDVGLRVLQIGADRSKRGILYPESPAAERQKAYGEYFQHLDIIGFSRTSDKRKKFELSPHVSIFPTNSLSPLLYGLDTLEIVRTLPKPDIVSAQDPFETGLIAWVIAVMKRAPLHIQVHTDFHAPEYARHSWINRIRSLIAWFVLHRAARVRVVSERIKHSIEARYRLRAPISVLPIFVDLQRFKRVAGDADVAARFSRFATRLLVVSRLEAEKNVGLALHAFAESAPIDACLIIVGEGSMREALKTSARALLISDRVFFEGAQDAAGYYKIADLVLVTSKYEGYGLVTIEALTSHKPVLSTDVGIARESGAIVAPAEKFPEALAEWFKNGPHIGHLKNYPYKNFEEYVQAYCEDIASSAK